MKNTSEELTSLIAQKFFFPNHTFSNVFFESDDGEKEMCDVLIEFIDFYVCIQVKEKDESATRSDLDWFAHTVLKKAKDQVKGSVRSLRLGDLKFYTYLQGETGRYKNFLSLDNKKAIIPIVVFCNCEYNQYNRFYFSESLNQIINIFSYADFCIMLDTIIIPYDIVGYLLQRGDYMPTHGGKRFVIEDLADDLTLFSAPQTEKDYAEFYLVQNYYKQNIKQENINFYNVFLSMLYKDYADKVPELFDMLISADIILANRIINYYCHTLENLNSNNWECPLFVRNNNGKGILFIRKPFDASDVELKDYINLFGTHYAYKYTLEQIYFLIFTPQTKTSFAIETGGCSYRLPTFDLELEQRKNEIDELIKGCPNQANGTDF